MINYQTPSIATTLERKYCNIFCIDYQTEICIDTVPSKVSQKIVCIQRMLTKYQGNIISNSLVNCPDKHTFKIFIPTNHFQEKHLSFYLSLIFTYFI